MSDVAATAKSAELTSGIIHPSFKLDRIYRPRSLVARTLLRYVFQINILFISVAKNKVALSKFNVNLLPSYHTY
jgi:hypothetical protein